MEFCVAFSPHIRNVDVAHSLRRESMDAATIILNPLSITGLPFTWQRFNCDYACLFTPGFLDGELYFIACLVHK